MRRARRGIDELRHRFYLSPTIYANQPRFSFTLKHLDPRFRGDDSLSGFEKSFRMSGDVLHGNF
jgi:hypothetical protein